MQYSQRRWLTVRSAVVMVRDSGPRQFSWEEGMLRGFRAEPMPLIDKRFGPPYRRITALYIADRVSDADAYLILLAISLVFEPVAGIGWSGLAAVTVINFCNFCLPFPPPALAAPGLGHRLTRRGRRPLAWVRRLVCHWASFFRSGVFIPCLP